MSRWMTTGAAVGAMTLAVATPAQAALVVQAQWNMATVPTMVDSKGGDNNGTTSGVTMQGGYYSFDGATSIAQVPHKDNLNPGTKNIRVQAKINTATPPAQGETYDIIRKGISSTPGGYYKLELRGTSSGTNAACIFKDVNKIVGLAMAPVPTGRWVNITCLKTVTTVKVVLSTGVSRTVTKSVGSISNTQPVHVGGKGDGTDVFSGLMDSASIAIG